MCGVCVCVCVCVKVIVCVRVWWYCVVVGLLLQTDDDSVDCLSLMMM